MICGFATGSGRPWRSLLRITGLRVKRRPLSTRSAVPQVEWHEAARSDLFEIVDYICDHNPDAAQQLLDNILAKVGKLTDDPIMYRPGRVEGTHKMLVRANYIVIYEEDPISVKILRVLHAAQQWPEER